MRLMFVEIKLAFADFRARCQRFLRGYAWADVWNFDTWFIRTAEPMLRHLEKHGCSYPSETTPEEWSKTLKHMADLLHLMSEDAVIEEKFGGYDELYGSGITKWTAEKDLAVKQIVRNSCEEFFGLFKKHFYDLWD